MLASPQPETAARASAVELEPSEGSTKKRQQAYVEDVTEE